MSRTILWLLVIAIVMGAFFYFCVPVRHAPKPKEKPIYGQITAKEWVPGYTNTWMMPMQSGDITIMIPMSDYVPDAYYLKIAGRIVAVRQDIFEKAKIGDMFGTPPETEK